MLLSTLVLKGLIIFDVFEIFEAFYFLCFLVFLVRVGLFVGFVFKFRGLEMLYKLLVHLVFVVLVFVELRTLSFLRTFFVVIREQIDFLLRFLLFPLYV